ncbi:MAG: NAD(P)H-dependent glycerol-3-phosphate dehydrogenase [bacterium]|nr:NAD(P)H-dependent glycerol-3-phosphate dehydrogenase [bacterium]
MSDKIGVIGAGAWGTTLANLLAKKGLSVTLWVYEEDLVSTMDQERENKIYLPGVSLSENLHPTSSLAQVCEGCETFLLVTPSHVTRQVAEALGRRISEKSLVISATKGIENETLMTISEILPQVLPQIAEGQFAYLSGPSFAMEVSRELPTAVAVASTVRTVADRVQALFTTPYFRVYTTPDVIGVELGGAVKNVMAIAAGISDGLGFGHDTRAALITRGLSEMARLGRAMGASQATFMGLAGLGDLVLTCTGDLSRNRTVGVQLGQGKKLDEILSNRKTVAEGVRTTRSVFHLSRKHGVEMPITEQVYAILYDKISPGNAVRELMSRDPREEPEAWELSDGTGWSP